MIEQRNEPKEQMLNPDGVLEDVIWKEIIDYEGHYSVNQFGQVKSHDRYVSNGTGERLCRGIIRKVYNHPSDSNVRRPTIVFSRENICESFSVMRLVAEAFSGIDKHDDNFRAVPMDGNPDNYYYKNVKMLTKEEFIAECLINIRTAISVAIYRKDADGNITEFESTAAAVEVTSISSSSIDHAVSSGETLHGATWYKCDPNKFSKLSSRYRQRKFIPNDTDLILAKIVAESDEEVIWKDVTGFDCDYVVNQFGQVKQSELVIRTSADKLDRIIPERFINVHMRSGDRKNPAGLLVYLDANHRKLAVRVLRLVADAFVGVDRSSNGCKIKLRDGSLFNVHPSNMILSNDLKYTSVVCTNRDGKQHRFNAMGSAYKKFGVSLNTMCKWLNNPDKYFRGWRWSYADDTNATKPQNGA